MQTQNKILDDLSRLASSALGIAAEMRTEVEAQFRQQFERILSQMDLVSREEFDAVKAMAAKAREEQEVLAERVSALEAELAGKAGPGKARTAKARPAEAKPAGAARVVKPAAASKTAAGKTAKAKTAKAKTAKASAAKASTAKASTAKAKTGGRKATAKSTKAP